MRTPKSLISVFLVGYFLNACGGGGGGGSGDSPAPAPTPTAPIPAPKAEGVYKGTTSEGESFQALILDNDEFWSLYGTESADTTLVTGFIQGQGLSKDGSYTSSDLKDFGYFPAIARTMDARYVAGTSLSGTLTRAGGSQTFTGTAMSAAEYDFATAATVSSVVGPWSMGIVNGASVTLSISASGTFSGISSEQCQFSGTVAPHSSGKNVFAFNLIFGGAPCLDPNQPANGIAITYLVNGGPTRQLIMLGVNSARTDGAGLIGTR